MQDLKSQKEKSESEKKDFQNKLKMLKEENNDSRNRNFQLHETLKVKTNDLQEAEDVFNIRIKNQCKYFKKSTTTTPIHQNPREQMNRTKMT